MSDGPINERVLLVKAKGGFGNRMLSATTGIILAELTDRTAVIDWREGGYQPKGTDSYSLFFDSPIDIDPAKYDDRVDVTPAVWSGRLGEGPVDLIEDHYPNSHRSPFVYRKLSIDLARPNTPGEVAVFWSYLPKSYRIRGQVLQAPQYRGLSLDDVIRQALMKYFRPNKRVRDEVENLFADRPDPVIGVHIRYTDRTVSLDRIFSQVTKLREQAPQAEIFLATDNDRVQEMFRARFPKVFVIEKNLGSEGRSLHEKVEHQDQLLESENALIDMWALSRCHWLVHSRVSTFSTTAALLGRIPKSRQFDIDRFNAKVVVKRWIQTWA